MKIKHGEAFERLEKMRKKVPEINYAEELDLLEDITNLNTVRSNGGLSYDCKTIY